MKRKTHPHLNPLPSKGEEKEKDKNNIDVSSFDETIEEAIDNPKEAVKLYLEDKSFTLPEIEKVMIGREEINA